MKKAVRKRPEPDMLDEYDFRGGVRGKHATRYAEGTNLVRLSADVAAVFPDSESVNEALRTLIRLQQAPRGRPAKPPATKRPSRVGSP